MIRVRAPAAKGAILTLAASLCQFTALERKRIRWKRGFAHILCFIAQFIGKKPFHTLSDCALSPGGS
jgi:hypothetical protein